MIYGLYSFRDHLSCFGSPFAHASANTAKRYFARLIGQSDGDIAFNPYDYDLYHVGDFDDSNGVVSVVTPIEYICNGGDLIGVADHEK